MKTVAKKILGLLMAAVLLILPLEAFAKVEQKTVKIGFYPYSGLQYVAKDGSCSGYTYDYLQEISKITGWEYEFYVSDFADCLEKLRNGEVDFMCGMQMMEQRLTEFEYPDYSCGVMYVGLYADENNKEIAYGDYEALAGIRVGVIESFGANNDLLKYDEKHDLGLTVKEYKNEEDMILALNDGELDAVCLVSLNAKQGLRCVAAFAYKDFYFMAYKGCPYVEEMGLAIEKIKMQNPYYEQDLSEQYFPVTIETAPVFTRAEKNYISSAGVINVAYNEGWAPLEKYNDETGEFDGANADIYAEISKLSGLKFNYVRCESYTEAYKALAEGRVDVICSTAHNYAWGEEKGLVLTRSFYNIAVVMLSSNNPEHEVQRIAMPADLYLTGQVKEEFKNCTFVEYSNYSECLEAVLDNKADATFCNSYLAIEYVNSSRYSNMKVTALNDCTVNYCSGISENKNPLLVSIIDKSLACISSAQIDDYIIEETANYKSIGLIDLLYQNPLEVLLVVVGVLLAFILMMVIIVINKSRYVKQIYKIVNVDDVTGECSSSRFMSEAAALINQSNRPQYMLAYINVVGFKDINNLYGYDTGDKLLRVIGSTFAGEISQGELAARLHTDRFVVMAKCENEEQFKVRYAQVFTLLCDELSNSQLAFRFNLSVGIYFLKAEDTKIETCIDRARYAHRLCSSEKYVVYDQKLERLIMRESIMESEMESALVNGEFQVYYQPKVNSKSERVNGAEALIRWQHPRYGKIEPAEFIPLFEKNGFILKTDYYVFSSVCRYLSWRKQNGLRLFPVSCNFSRLHLLNRNFPDELAAIADSFGVEHSFLNVEITETVAVADMEIATPQLARLHALGFLLSIDDFGSGYSSLAILSEVEIDEIKLDRSLIVNAADSEKNKNILSGIISIMHSLGKSIVCEGVENRAQVELLQELDCYNVQGYYYARPLPENEFTENFAAD